MKFTLSWLRTHLETDASLERIANTLTDIGLELEGVENPADALAGFQTAYVVEAVQHPNADRLRACKVDTGAGIISVVCGAPNARTGLKVVLGRPGAVVPANGMVLKVGEIRGVKSEGMMCSSRELGLGDDHEGIIELPADTPVGIQFAEYAHRNDPVIEIAVTPNRGDALSVRGVARDLAAAGIGTLKPWSPSPVEATFASPLTWKIEHPTCQWVLGRTVRGVTNGPSPQWLQERLTSIGLRPINALVDMTNFFTIDLGRPLHVFDADKVQGGVLTFRPGNGETFAGLNGKDITVRPEDCAIADASGVVSLAGVVGGESTGCDENTQNVFIECAWFDPVAVALSGRFHGVSSDARARFERGIDPALMPAALDAATQMVIALCGGEASDVAEAGAEPKWQRTATLRFARLASFGGLDVPADAAILALEKLGFTVAARDAASVAVNVPSWRNDVAGGTRLEPFAGLSPEQLAAVTQGAAEIEPECDLIEEVLRLQPGGLQAVPPVSLPVPGAVPAATLSPAQYRKALARRVLAAAGMAECVTFSFMPREAAALFGAAPDSLHLANPIASDLDQMRPTAIATLALAAARNQARGVENVALFEIGPVFQSSDETGQPFRAAGLRAGQPARHWQGAAAPTALDAKADVLAVLAALGVPMEALTVTADAPGYYHPGQSGCIRQGPKTVLASFGALHPRVLAALDLAGPAIAFEIHLDAIQDPKRKKKSQPDLAAFQPVRRDFAFVVDADVQADAVLRAARGAERNLVAGVSLFDVYQGDKLDSGKKSLAIEVVLQPREKTLTDAEIEAVAARVVAAVAKACGGVLR
jgi:phenylalanyl-tRNA synthetase beta chain